MTMLDRPRENLLKLIKSQGKDLKTVSEGLGRNSAYLHQYLTRGSPRELQEGIREKLGHIFGVSPSLFKAGTDAIVAEKYSKNIHVSTDTKSELILRVPELDISPQAGGGAIVSDIIEHQQPVGHWSFPRTLVGSFVNDLSKLAIVRVAGDSMEPDYRAGDRILVDTGHIMPSPAGVYVLWDGIGVVLKRVEIVMGVEPKRIRIMSINPAYQVYELPLDEVQINGRVVGKWDWK
ncbi:S24 family peptidase [Acetobacter thailandicus]|uniref:S24 family peptidase n=1 Tax=Acetobacter thailandicus TaxID=1502842 RepID=UPI001BADA311|nr:helix-turn-helix transcriptional regulator [Acetobacter thailandicus]MBS1003195.1 helix-turn-helix transcriptional regulator [Acetobacter thailandicus]